MRDSTDPRHDATQRRREIEVVLDEDGYTELRYWTSLDITPAEAAAVIASALAAITAFQSSVARINPARRARVVLAGYDGAVTEQAGEDGMPGPPDHVAEQEHGPDPARPREPDHLREAPAPSADLQGRLERLPVGHPSSPYHGDGSRKPPPPDRTQYELPLPDELPPDADADQADTHLPEDAARVDPDGSWHWKGRDLAPEQSRIADQAVARCREAEGRDADGNYGDHGLTPAMRRIEAQLAHSRLAEDTEEYALKEPDRFKEKLARLISNVPGSDTTEIISKINDGVRYTYICNDENYTPGVGEVCTSLADAGFELYERKNVWIDETKSYQGVNSSWMDHQTGQLFEVQVHTPESWQAKQASHRSYEIIESLSSTAEERAEAIKIQDRIFREVPIPPDVRDISSYRKEGW
jgi:hypothetical protein